jgi:hypothetical protein
MRNQKCYGPIRHPNRKVIANSAGVQTISEAGARVPPAPPQWEAGWIWLDPAIFPDRQSCPYSFFDRKENFIPALAVFQKNIRLPETPERVLAWMSADTKYRLFVNDRLAGRGPAEVGGDYDNRQPPDWWFYDAYDLTSYFHAGENSIRVEVVHGPVVQADYSMGHGGLLFQADLSFPSTPPMIVLSDASWLATQDDGYLAPHRYDARYCPCFSADTAEPRRQWFPAKMISPAISNHWRIHPREIPPLAEVEIRPTRVDLLPGQIADRFLDLDQLCAEDGGSGAEILAGDPVTILFRFEKELAGHPCFSVAGAEGTVMELGLQEIDGLDTRVETYVLKAGRQCFETIEYHAVQIIRLRVSFPGGSQCPTSLKIYSLGVNFRSFPVQYAGSFSCSDPFLNRLWDVCRWTTQLCMQAYHLDSPVHQEGLGCTGDYRIEALVSQAAFGETRLARQDLLRTAYLLHQKHGVMFHTSYSLVFVMMVEDYWLHTADKETLESVFPAVIQVLDLFAGYVGATGLVTQAPNYMFLDWVERDGFSLHHPPAVLGTGTMSAFYYRALQAAIALCAVVDQTALAGRFAARAADLKTAFWRELWVQAEGLFCDGKAFQSRAAPNAWRPEDQAGTYFSRHTNALAVAFGLAPLEQRSTILRRILADDTLPLVQPYFMHYVFDALAQAGEFEQYAFRELRKWKLLLDEHPSSLKECWDMGDYSHAWGATPAIQLSRRVLGVTPQQAGFAVVQICPCLGDLDWAAGEVPTPYGPIRCRWQKSEFYLEGDLVIPEGVIASFVISASLRGSYSRVELDHRGFSAIGQTQSFPLRNGSNRLVFSRD